MCMAYFKKKAQTFKQLLWTRSQGFQLSRQNYVARAEVSCTERRILGKVQEELQFFAGRLPAGQTALWYTRIRGSQDRHGFPTKIQPVLIRFPLIRTEKPNKEIQIANWAKLNLWDTPHTLFAPCAYLFVPCPHCSYSKKTQMYFTLVPKNVLIAKQKSFIRKRHSQLTARDLFCFYTHKSGFLVLLVSADIYIRPVLKSCLAPSRHHLPTLWCQMLLLFASSPRISEHTQQPSAELSPSSPQFSIILPSKQQLL